MDSWTLWLLIAALLWIASSYFSPAAGAKRIRKQKEKIYQAPDETKVVDAAAYPHLDLDWYRSCAETLEAQGFARLADVEPNQGVAIAKPLFVRVLVSSDGVTLASAYNFRARGVTALLASSLRDLRVVDFESEFSDGTFVVTTNAYAARHAKAPPAIQVRYFEEQTPLEELLDIHIGRVHEHIASAERIPARVASLAAALESQKRLKEIKAGFELARGHEVSREELQGFATDSSVPGTAEVAEEVADEMVASRKRRS